MFSLETSQRVKEIKARYRAAKNKRQAIGMDSKWHTLDKYDIGQQWENNTPAWIPKPVTNWIHTVKVTKRAAFAIENPVGQILPLSPEDKDKAQQLQQIYEYEWQRLGATKYMRSAIEDGKLLGTGIVQFYWNENTEVRGGTNGLYEGEVEMRRIDPANFYPDPQAFSLEECRYIHIVERKSLEWLKNHPTFGGNHEETHSTEDDRGEIYKRDYSSSTEGKNDIIDFHTHYEKIQQKEGGFRYRVTYLVGDKIVHTIDDLQPRCYPFAIYRDFPQRHHFWGLSTCSLILENQKIINKVEAIIALIGTHLQNPQRIVNKRSGINPREVARYGSAPGHVFVSNGAPERAITWAQPPPIPEYLFRLMEQAKENIREVTGITESYQGMNVGSLQTSSGVEQLIERATMRDRDQMFEVEEFVEQMTRILLRFITTNYDTERYARFENEQGDMDFISYFGTDYQGLEYDFRIDVSAKAPMSRQKMQEEMDRLLEIQGQYGYDPAIVTPEEYMEIAPFSNQVRQRILRRMENERVINNTESLVQVAMMISEAIQSGVPEEEVQQMAMEMVEQREQARKQGIGSAHGNDPDANSGQIQKQQAGTGGM